MPKRILWLSRHSILPAQRCEIDRVWPEAEVVVDSATFSDASDICSRIKRGSFDEVILVAPLSLLYELTKRGIYPIRAEMQRVDYVSDPDSEVYANGRAYKFVKFVRVKRLDLVTEDI